MFQNDLFGGPLFIFCKTWINTQLEMYEKTLHVSLYPN